MSAAALKFSFSTGKGWLKNNADGKEIFLETSRQFRRPISRYPY
jgi:hypothetical protein